VINATELPNINQIKVYFPIRKNKGVNIRPLIILREKMTIYSLKIRPDQPNKKQDLMSVQSVV
jgi:hypothetical protein